MKQYRITITIHREAESSEDAVTNALDEFLPGSEPATILAQNVDSPCDSTFLGLNLTQGKAA